MAALLAYAAASDQSSSSVIIIVIAATLILLVSGLAFLPVFAAWKRRHRQAENIVALSLLWGLLAAGTLMNATIQQIKWQREYLDSLRSGYLDPTVTPADSPKLPLVICGLLVAFYALIILWSLKGKAGRRQLVAGVARQRAS